MILQRPTMIGVRINDLTDLFERLFARRQHTVWFVVRRVEKQQINLATRTCKL